jgi:hypothetical protein
VAAAFRARASAMAVHLLAHNTTVSNASVSPPSSLRSLPL